MPETRAIRIDGGALEILTDAKPNNLSWLQSQVKGYIESVWRTDSVLCLGNEEARLLDMPFNLYRQDGEPLHGPLLVLGIERDDFRGLTSEEMHAVKIFNNVLFLR